MKPNFTRINGAFFRSDESGQLYAVSDPETLKGLKAGHLPYSSVENTRGLTFSAPTNGTMASPNPSPAPTPTPTPAPAPAQSNDVGSMIKQKLIESLTTYKGVTDVTQLEQKRQELLRKQLLSAPYSAEGENTLTGSAKLTLLRNRGSEFEPELKSLEEQIINARKGDETAIVNLQRISSIAKDLGLFETADSGYQSGLGKEYADYVANERANGNDKPMTLNEYANMDANRKKSVTQIIGESGMTTQQNATFKTLSEQQAKSPLVAAADRTIVVDTVSKALKSDPKNASLQLSFIYSFIQMLDTYQSAVREGEIGIVSGTQGLVDKLTNIPDKISQGTTLSTDVINNYIATAKILSDSIKSGANKKKQDYAARAKVAGIEKAWNEYVSITESNNKQTETPETKIVNGVTYVKVEGGWKKQ